MNRAFFFSAKGQRDGSTGNSRYHHRLKSVIETLRSAKERLPAGEAKDEIEAKLAEAESAMKRSDAKLAKELGYILCQCTFPPTPMLWKEQQNAHVCSNPECGRKIVKIVWPTAESPTLKTNYV